MANELTAERLRELLHYDPETGVFTWRVARGRTAKAGDVAGSELDGYVCIMVQGRSYRSHRLAFLYMEGRWPDPEVDHQDTDRKNNRWVNLREVSHQSNTQNQRRARVTSKLGVLGVEKHPRSGRFRARIRVGGKIFPLGWHDTAEAAHAAYVAAKRELHAGCTI